MSLEGTSAIERVLQRVLVPLAVLSGASVLAGFFFPSAVGTTFSGEAWLTLALLFFGSALGYLAVIPAAHDTGEPQEGAEYLLRIRRMSWRQTLAGFLGRHDTVTFALPVLVFAIYFALQIAIPSATVGTVNVVRDVLLQDAGWLFLGAMFLAVVYCFWLLLGPWGDIKLGGPGAEPGYTYPTYFSLVFTAGIAAGIVFWGPAEALFHFQTPPPYFGAEAQTDAAVLPALTYALFHWGVSAWSAYTVIAVPIAYYVYQRGAPLRVSTILAPFLGVEGLDSRWTQLVDTLAIFATIGGIATSVALVSQQFLTGINYQWGVSAGDAGPLLFVGGLTLIFILSATTGIHRGIRRIAGLNVVLFGVFALILVAIGPLSFVIDRGTAAVGSYAINFVPMSFFMGPDWVAAWTVWNWSWWFSWAPFAGLFLAALSRGRTVRTVVFTGVVATSAATMVWFILMGATSLQLQTSGAADILGAINAGGGSAVSGFPIFAALPLSDLLIFLFLGLIVVFITTSADTSTLVVSILATKRGMAPTSTSIAFWGVFQGAVALAVLILGGGETLQAMAVLTGGPFAVISLVALAGLTLTFRRHEGGHTSILRQWFDRLPETGQHVGLDPPSDE